MIIYPNEQFIFQPIMQVLASYKIRNSINKNNFENTTSLQQTLTQINFEMDFLDENLILTQDNVTDNPSKRLIFKSLLNRYILIT